MLKTPLQNAQAQAQALQSAQVQAQALQAANQGTLSAAHQYSALTAAAAGRAAAVAGMPGLALPQG